MSGICTKCGPCGGRLWETVSIPGKKFASEKECEKAVEKNNDALKSKPISPA